MKKEKNIRTYQRRTKSGKLVTVKAHTAKYDAAEKAKELAKKKGAGEEIESALSRKKMEALVDAYADKHGLVYEEDGVYSDSKGRNFVLGFTNGKVVKKQVNDFLTANYEATKGKKKKASPVEKEKLPKETKTPKTKEAKPTTSEPAFTAAEFKEWYQGTGSAADKKVAKALRAQLGRSGYKKLEDEAIDNYSARGHLSMFKRVSAPTTETPTKTSSKMKESAKTKTINAELMKSGLTMYRTSTGGIEIYRVGDRRSLKNLVAGVHYNGKHISFGGANEKENKAKYSAVLSKVFSEGVDTGDKSHKRPPMSKSKTKKSYTTAKRMKPSEVADMTTKRDWIYEG